MYRYYNPDRVTDLKTEVTTMAFVTDEDSRYALYAQRAYPDEASMIASNKAGILYYLDGRYVVKCNVTPVWQMVAVYDGLEVAGINWITVYFLSETAMQQYIKDNPGRRYSRPRYDRDNFVWSVQYHV